ncbi:MAG: sulfite exporter TauE/SafE family protein [Bacteroidales bacterium]
MSPLLALVLFAAGGVAGLLGALLGLGGGVFLVPFFVLVLRMPMHMAVGVSLITVIATSSVVSAGTAGHRLMNMRLGMTLEAATTAGALVGGIVAAVFSARMLQALFALLAAATAAVMLTRLDRRNVRPAGAGTNPGRLGGSYYEAESGGEVTYAVRRLPLGLAASFVAGSVSSLLGVGGGIIKVPALNAWCGVPLRAAAATSAFMIGVTASVGAFIYFWRGHIVPAVAAATVLGVLAGSRVGFFVGERARAKWLKLLMAIVLFVVSALMMIRALV